jgi:hypothetical protein
MLNPVITSGKGSFGQVLPGWSVQEDAVPAAIGSNSGGLGSVSFSAARTDDSVFLAQKPITSTDVAATGATRLGSVSGRITSVSEQGATVKVTHDTLLSKLNVDRTLGPTGIWGDKIARRQLADTAGNLSTKLEATALAISADGLNVYAAVAGIVQVFSRFGRYASQFGSYPGEVISGLDFDSSNNLYVVLKTANRVDKYDAAGNFLLSFGSTGTGNGQLSSPRQIAWDSTNSLLWVADANNDRIAGFNTSGTWVRNAGTTGTGTGQLRYPIAVTCDQGRIYVGDITKRIQCFTGSTGVVDGARGFGGKGSDPGLFSSQDQEEFAFAIASGIFLVRDAEGIHGFRMDTWAPFPTISLPKRASGLGSAIAGRNVWFVTATRDPSNAANYGFDKYATGARLECVFEKYIAAADETLSVLVTFPLGLYQYNFPSWSGNVADKVRELASCAGVDMAVAGGNIYLTPMGDPYTLNGDNIQVSPPRTPSGRNTARALQFTNQNVGPRLWPKDVYRNEAYIDGMKFAAYQSSFRVATPGYTLGTSMSRDRQMTVVFNGGDTTPGGVLISGTVPYQVYKGRTYQVDTFLWPGKSTLMQIGIQWPDGSISWGTPISTPANTWTNLWMSSYVAPADGEAKLIVSSASGTGYSAWAANDILFIAKVLFGELKNGTYRGFFDGGSADSIWLGEPDASPSMKILWDAPDITGSHFPSPTVYSAYDDNNRVFSVKAGEVIEEKIQTSTSMTFLEPPEKSDDLPVGSNSYFITDGSNLPITAGEWNAYGGKVEAAIDPDDATLIHLKITGPREDIPGVTGPYYLANSDGQNRYAQLNLRGFGVTTKPEVITIATGASPALATSDLGPLVNSPFHASRAAIYQRVMWALDDAAGPNLEVTLSVPTDGLSFGYINGALIRYKEAIYRVRSITFGNATTQLICSKYTTVADFNSRHSGETTGQVDTAWYGYSVGDVNVAPLR